MRSDTEAERIAVEVGFASILLFGMCAGAAGTLVALGETDTAAWFGIPMSVFLAFLSRSMCILEAREAEHD